jgi:hypothetical protein
MSGRLLKMFLSVVAFGEKTIEMGSVYTTWQRNSFNWVPRLMNSVRVCELAVRDGA